MDAWLCTRCKKEFDEYHEKCPLCGGRVKEFPKEEEPKVKLVKPKKKESIEEESG